MTTLKERLQKLLAQAGIASRRSAETMIEQGRITINGEVATLGDKADPEADIIMVDRVRLRIEAVKKIYIALNKPKQVLSTSAPHKGDERRTIYDLVNMPDHLFSIGRLDADSEGLIVLTNDGTLAQRLSHPSYRHSKTYRVDVVGLPDISALDQWRNGVFLDEDGRTAPCIVTVTHGNIKESTLSIIMTEGKKRQIRRIGVKLGHHVRKLVRTHIGMLSLGNLKLGEWRELTMDEVKLLKTPSPELKGLKAAARSRVSADGTESSSVIRTAAPRPRRTTDEGDRARRSLVADDDRPRRSQVDDEDFRPRRSLVDEDDRPRRSADDSDRPRRTASDSDRPRRTTTSDTDRPRRSADETDSPRRTASDSDRPRRATTSDTDRPRRSAEDSDRPRRAASDTDRPRRSADDSDRPRRTTSDSDRPRRAASDTDRPRRAASDTDRPRRTTTSDTDRPRRSADDSDRPRRTTSDTNRPRRSADDSDRPRRAASDTNRPRRTTTSDSDRPRRTTTSDADRPRRSADDSDRPRRTTTSDSDRPRRSSADRDTTRSSSSDQTENRPPKRRITRKPTDSKQTDRTSNNSSGKRRSGRTPRKNDS